MLLYVRQMRRLMLCVRSIALICGPVDPGGMIGVCPGLKGGTKGTADIVAYIAGDNTNARCPRRPPPFSE